MLIFIIIYLSPKSYALFFQMLDFVSAMRKMPP